MSEADTEKRGGANIEIFDEKKVDKSGIGEESNQDGENDEEFS